MYKFFIIIRKLKTRKGEKKLLSDPQDEFKSIGVLKKEVQKIYVFIFEISLNYALLLHRVINNWKTF